MITQMRLVDGAREMVLYPREGVAAQSLDVGSPAVREVSEARADDDGDRDTTSLYGGRAVAVELVLYEDPAIIAQLLDELTSYLHPRLRPYLHVVDDGWQQERRIRLRVDQYAAPYDGYLASLQRATQAQWKAPDGVWEAVDDVTVTLNADVVTTAGITFPITLPLVFATTTSTGATQLANLGAVPSHFTAKLYGPCTAPALINESSDERIAFTSSLILGAGEYVEINTQDRTAYLNSMTGASRLNFIDYDVTTWWRIEPGDQTVRYAPATVSAGAVAEITYRPAWF